MPRKPTRIAPEELLPPPVPLPGPDPAYAVGPDLEALLRDLNRRILDAMNRHTAAILAAGIMASRGRPHTPEEALRLHQEMINTMWPPAPAQARAESISI